MRVLMISNLYRPEPTGVGPYSAGLAEALVARGHEVTVVCANPSYPHWRLQPGYSGWRWSKRNEFGVSVYRCPVFIPHTVTGLTRLLHYSSFTLSASLSVLNLARRFQPDIVFSVAPTLLSAPLGLAAARVSGAISWLHVQDFEVEAGMATGQMHRGSLGARLGLGFERLCINGFDAASSISAEMCAKLIEKGRDPRTVHEFRNWADVHLVQPRSTSEYREQWNIRTPHVALYSGSIAKKQGIEVIVDVARRMRDRKDLTFVICGNGPTRHELEAMAVDIPLLQIHDLQPMDRLGDLLNLATIHLLPQKRDAAGLVLPSKLTNMLASGKPVIAGVAADRGLAQEISGCGLVVEPESAEALEQAISMLTADKELYCKLSKEARSRAEERWSKDRIIDGIERVLLENVARARRPLDGYRV